jgi:hypothetical protein
LSQNTSSAVMQQRVEPHDSLDDFPTPPWATRALMEYVIKPQIGLVASSQLSRMTVREPCCNRGYMARPLAEYFGRVIATDIFDYGYEAHQTTQDYLWPDALVPAEFTITNPPFRLAEQIIARSFDTPIWRGTAVIVRNAFLEGVERYQELFSKTPPTTYAQFSERVIMTKGIVRDPAKEYWDEKTRSMKRPSTATSYCWLVWLKDVPRQPVVWIPPCRKALERSGDYA